jgi:hypothetical protein
MFFIFVVGTVAVLLKPIIKVHGHELLPAGVSDRLRRISSRLSEQKKTSAASAVGKRAGALLRIYDFTQVPLRLMVETLQIISSFRKTMLLAWPPVYTAIIKRLTILNFSFLTLPSTACATPQTSLYNLMNGITLGTTVLLFYMSLLWAIGRLVMRARQWEASRITAFDRKTMLRTVAVLTFVYTPLTDVVLAVFSCRSIVDEKYLRQDMVHQCYVGDHVRYYKAAIFWTIIYVVGIPVFFLALLFHYQVPTVARDLQRAAQLRALVQLARRRRIALPAGLEFEASISAASIKEEHLDALYRAFISGDAAEDDGSEPALPMRACCPAAGTSAASSTPAAEKLALLLSYAAAHLESPVVSWQEARGDPRLEGAEDTIGSLYNEYYVHSWYWSIVEVFQKASTARLACA